MFLFHYILQIPCQTLRNEKLFFIFLPLGVDGLWFSRFHVSRCYDVIKNPPNLQGLHSFLTGRVYIVLNLMFLPRGPELLWRSFPVLTL